MRFESHLRDDEQRERAADDRATAASTMAVPFRVVPGRAGRSATLFAGYGDGGLPGLNLCGAGRVVGLVDPVGDV